MPQSPDCIQQPIENLATSLTLCNKAPSEPLSAEKEPAKSEEVDDLEPIIQNLPTQDHLTKISVSSENSNNKQINENLGGNLSKNEPLDSPQILKSTQHKSISSSLDSMSCLPPSSKKAYIVAALVLLSVPLVYHAYTDIEYTPVIDKINQLFAIATSKETFDTVIGPFVENVGLPLIRSGCYVTAMFLGTQKVAQALAALGLKFIPGARSLENKINEAFKRHLVRDVCLVIGLLGTGLLLEGLESDLNIYLQQLEINEKPLTHLFNGNFMEFLTGMRTALFDSDKSVVNLVDELQNTDSEIFPYIKNYLNKLEPIAKTAIYSMKRMRLTPLESHSILELKFGLPLRRFGITKNPEFSAITNFFHEINLSKMTTDIKNCLTTECLNEKKNLVLQALNSAYDTSAQFMESPFENTKRIVADYTSEMINRTLAWQLYVKVNNIKNYASSLFT